MELAVSKTENFLGTWGREIPGQGRSDRTEEDLEQLVPHSSTPVAPHARTPGIFPEVSQTNSKAWCCLGTAVMGTLQKREKHYCDFSAQIGKKKEAANEGGVELGWVEEKEGWRRRVGRGQGTGKWKPRDFKGSEAVPQLGSPGPTCPCPPGGLLAFIPNWEMFTSPHVC